MPDPRDLLDVLKDELQFVKEGGYRNSTHSPWRPQFVFEDSPSCVNARIKQDRIPCTECVLIDMVPLDRREEKVPCRHIPLKETGETVEYFYRCGTQQELEEALTDWLRKTIARLEEPSVKKAMRRM